MDGRVAVRIAELAVLRREGVLTASGLGSCVGVALYDPVTRVAGLAHVFLPSSRNGSPHQAGEPARYADWGVPALVKAMVREGAWAARVVAKLVGGARLFLRGEELGLDIGRRNVEAVHEVLKQLGIPIVARDVGGYRGRTMEFFAGTGRVRVYTVGLPVREL